ncbi:MAG: Uma2 family endonuclease [Bryobacterales bacterium]|nr:Uma2 family endonuclease [Bryobacterales bacterium]
MTEQEYLTLRHEGLAPEYRDGEVVERYGDDFSHGSMRATLAGLPLPGYGAMSQSIRLRPGRWVVADLAVYYPDEPAEDYPTTTPFLVIEVLARQDRMMEVLSKLAEYREFGVTHVWLADPPGRKLYVMESEFRQVTTWQIQQPPLRISAEDVFDS